MIRKKFKFLSVMFLLLFLISFVSAVKFGESNKPIFLSQGNSESVDNSAALNLESSEGDVVFSRGGVNYIERDGEEYILMGDEEGYGLMGDGIFPSSVCGNEKIDIGITGKLAIELGNPECSVSREHNLCIQIWEEDSGYDDLVTEKCGSFFSEQLTAPFTEVTIDHRFQHIDLSDEIISDAGGNGEFYITITEEYYRGCVNDYTTVSEDVYGYVNGECKCLSGACCDLRSRPYDYKSSGTQPTEYSDEYYCSGSNSPTKTNYVKKKSYYCNGNDASVHYSTTPKDNCGTCEKCVEGSSFCNFYSSSTFFGIKDCDTLDTSCRNYHDVDKKCNGAGGVTNPICSSYTNKASGTSCGTNKICDGAGSCVDNIGDCHNGLLNGDGAYCSDTCKCDVGEGDCDGSGQCKDGLVCVNDVGAKYGWPSNYDVCESTNTDTKTVYQTLDFSKTTKRKRRSKPTLQVDCPTGYSLDNAWTKLISKSKFKYPGKLIDETSTSATWKFKSRKRKSKSIMVTGYVTCSK